MSDSAFPDLDLNALKIFSHKIGRKYPAISHISLYYCARPEHKYVLLFEIQDPDPLESRAARSVFFCADVLPFHDIKGRPGCIQDSEDEWLFWPIDKSINEEFPHALVIESSKYDLYMDNNLRWQDIKVSAQGEYEIEKINEICKKAKYNNQIDVLGLAHILGCDEQYNDILPIIWKKYQLDLHHSGLPQISSVNEKIGTWFLLLLRFSHGTVDGMSRENLNYRTQEIPTFQGINGNPEIISLDELKKYFTEFLEIPLPLKLFPFIETTEKKTSKSINVFFETAPDPKFWTMC